MADSSTLMQRSTRRGLLENLISSRTLKFNSVFLTVPLLSCLRPSVTFTLRSIGRPEETTTYCTLPKPEDPPQLEAHQRMEEFADRHERQPVVHGVFDDGPFPTIVKSVGVSPESVGTTYLLVYESDRWLPVRDTCPPAQPNPEQAEPIVDQGSLFRGDRERRENPEAKFRGRDTLEVCRIGEEGEHFFAWQRQAHGALEDVCEHAPYCSRRHFSDDWELVTLSSPRSGTLCFVQLTVHLHPPYQRRGRGRRPLTKW